MAKSDDTTDAIVIKKYANRRLYDTSSSKYVTLDHLRDLVKRDIEFTVVDAKSGEDLTRGVLAQIIFEEEAKGANLLPLAFLRQLIGFYGDSLQTVVPGYLQMSMESFAQQQEAMRERFAGAMSNPATAMSAIEEQTKRNMAMFQDAMKTFMPFAAAGGMGTMPQPDPAPEEDDGEIDALRAELDAMKAKLDKLAGS
ncbi:polyhydroxyalkanoate synthesis repressor PhaR [Hyphobacterium marinum]|uniref:Polyhydroxyalkanoate synthesis repressor PhaR n=1 Tax=Hyphobacterium marinum TaxID=3116574 RepID=A0ABU7LXT7_9PROT|nr:polyhydroxyalkanoate synthesis repressor PhaR [Hyphobacterium sp. Y6023]MEE2566345.1 polyhydroxyalkanoate synthesis repressor PhaR [Hyphobacterium sp. Y6023]